MLAHNSGDYAAALQHWAIFRENHPANRSGYIGAIRTAKAAKDDEAVASLLSAGLDRFPEHATRLQAVAEGTPLDGDNDGFKALLELPAIDPATEVSAAMAPFNVRQRLGRKARHKESRARVEAVLDRFPDYAPACLARLTVLRTMRRGRKAAKLAAKYIEKFPDDVGIALANIAISAEQNEHQAALAFATDLRNKVARSVEVEVAYIQALSGAGRLDEADAVCAEAIAGFPNNIVLLCEHAGLATRRGDWTEALDRWMAAETLQPTSNRIKVGLEAVRLQLAELDGVDTDTSQSELAQLFARFESLGGNKGGCEFGMVQRKFGVNALGLLRWSNIKFTSLVDGLNKDFAGLGLLENTELGVVRAAADREEYKIRDTCYGLGGHTFIAVKDVPRDKMLVQTARRLQFLGTRLLEDIRNVRKIFIYKMFERAEDARLFELFTALRRHGPAKLLCVIKADDTHAKGTVRKLQDGLFAGYFGHFMADAAGGSRGIDFATWKDVCTATIDDHSA